MANGGSIYLRFTNAFLAGSDPAYESSMSRVCILVWAVPHNFRVAKKTGVQQGPFSVDMMITYIASETNRTADCRFARVIWDLTQSTSFWSFEPVSHTKSPKAALAPILLIYKSKTILYILFILLSYLQFNQ